MCLLSQLYLLLLKGCQHLFCLHASLQTYGRISNLHWWFHWGWFKNSLKLLLKLAKKRARKSVSFAFGWLAFYISIPLLQLLGGLLSLRCFFSIPTGIYDHNRWRHHLHLINIINADDNCSRGVGYRNLPWLRCCPYYG